MSINLTGSLGLLIFFSFFKASIVFLLSRSLYLGWKNQKKKYWSDFPFLMSIFFVIYSISKLFDICLYYYMRNQPESGNIIESNLEYAALLGKLRIFTTCLTLAPLVYLMMIIWFNNQKKAKITSFSLWVLVSSVSILIADSYQQLLIANVIISVIPLLFSIITYFILHYKKKMGMINNLLLAIGWSLVLITQIIRPIWTNLGDSIWGLTWIAEILETLPFIMIWYGYKKPSKYFLNSLREKSKNSKEEKLFSENDSYKNELLTSQF